VSEAGDVELVVRQPKHPYTQLLIGSIPSPNPRHRWTSRRGVAIDAVAPSDTPDSCRFASRCPYVMPKCRERHPPLFRADEHRVVACYLHEDARATESAAMDQVFVR
jgi:peptide/nickel transport system ATP-binding protein